MLKEGYIYCFTSPSNKKYYGKTINIKKRLIQHRNTKNTNWYFCRAIKKYGFQNFKFEIIENFKNIEKEFLNEREKFWINKDNTNNEDFGYNLTIGGDGTPGYKQSEEAKRKIGDFNRGKFVSIEKREKMSNFQKGKVVSELSRKKQSESISGEKNHFYGKHHTEESKNKISNSLSGEKHPQYGKKQSSETIKKKVISLTGKPHKRIICEYCNKETDDRNYHRWHGTKCKNNKE
jgi:group I intron endonuclease